MSQNDEDTASFIVVEHCVIKASLYSMVWSSENDIIKLLLVFEIKSNNLIIRLFNNIFIGDGALCLYGNGPGASQITEPPNLSLAEFGATKSRKPNQ